MRFIVGYMATPSGEDGLSLGVLIARSLGAAIDICLVIPPEHTVPARVPADPGYEGVLVEHAREWLAEAHKAVPDDVEAQTHLSVHDSPAQGLLNEATRLEAQLIVVGAAEHGLLGRHSLGTVSTELLHSSHVPVVLAPRGIRHSKVGRVRELTCAIGTEPGSDADVLLRTAVGACEQLHTPLRLVSLVVVGHSLLGLRGARAQADEAELQSARERLEAARSVVPPEVPVTTEIVQGATVESAISNLEWHDGDMLMVGSSRLAAARRLFLGSKAAKMLRVIPVPMVVVPNLEPVESE